MDFTASSNAVALRFDGTLSTLEDGPADRLVLVSFKNCAGEVLWVELDVREEDRGPFSQALRRSPKGLSSGWRASPMEVESIRCREEVCSGVNPGMAFEVTAISLASVMVGPG